LSKEQKAPPHHAAIQPQHEQQVELDTLDAAGYTMEDMVDMELARQEANWQKSLSESFDLNPISKVKSSSTKIKLPRKPKITNTIITRAKARRS
jgi:hypothetical protein